MLEIRRASTLDDIKKEVAGVFASFEGLLPRERDLPVLLKPNFNSNMNALTGNTTDLRIVAAVIEELRRRSYTDIIIGEGTNSGFYREGISVISRLAADSLAKHYGVRIVDLNLSSSSEMEMEGGIRAELAKEVVEAAFMINLPKLKTHFEANMSVCLKNLMGCLIGQANKKKAHTSLAKNILRINDRVRPGLHIVDAIISMEGLGPTRGTPVKTGLIIAGDDPYVIDLVAARLAGFDYRKIPVLAEAERSGRLKKAQLEAASSVNLRGHERRFAPPKAGFLANFIHNPRRQRYFLAIRNTAVFNYLCSTNLFGKLLFVAGLRQDMYIKNDLRFKGFRLLKERCRPGCTRCSDYCPLGIKLPERLEDSSNGCIGCQYCFLVCPTNAIEFKGELGFLAEQIRQYDKITREIA